MIKEDIRSNSLLVVIWDIHNNSYPVWVITSDGVLIAGIFHISIIMIQVIIVGIMEF